MSKKLLKSSLQIIQLSSKNLDNTVSVKNSVNRKIDVAILKNGNPLIVFRGQAEKGVSEGDSAGMLLTPKLYVWYTSQITKGELFESQISEPESQVIDLTQFSNDIEVKLQYSNESSGKKEWVISNK